MICVDASVATKWVLDEDDSDKAVDLYQANQESVVIAPAFLPVEVTNAIRKRVARGLATPAEGEEMLRTFLGYTVALAAPRGIYELALRLADQFDRPAVYDMHYVALAQLAGCDLWTADLRLLNALGGRLPFVRPLDSYTR